MLYLAQYQRYRRDCLQRDENLRLFTRQHWTLRSNQYEAKCPPMIPSSPSNVSLDHQQPTVLFLAQLESIGKKSMDKTSQQSPNTPEPKRTITDPNKYLFPSLKSPATKSSLSNHAMDESTLRSVSARVKSKGTNLKVDASSTMLKLNKQEPDVPLIVHRSSQSRMHGVEHIVNLGRWSERKATPETTTEPELCTETDASSLERSLDSDNDQFKSPFPKEYDQAIALQGQLVANNSYHDWNLRDFYRDVQTPLDPSTNTRSVFERCLKLARLQANTIKWEQRRRQNLNIYHRLLKTSSPDHNLSTSTNASLSSRPHLDRDINELKRELRCQDCKRYTCLGNCAPGHDYHQYKRIISLTTILSSREPSIRSSKLTQRQARSSLQFRPRSRHELVHETKYKLVSSQINPISMVSSPLIDANSLLKPSNKK